MTLTTLEPIQLEDYDFAIPCETCSAAATRVMKFICTCNWMLCESCLDHTLSWYAEHLPSRVHCEVHTT